MLASAATTDGMRKFIEARIARVFVRTCPRCGLQFQKQDGCNKMTCHCGHVMCYVCRADVAGYEHFCQRAQCTKSPFGAVSRRHFPVRVLAQGRCAGSVQRWGDAIVLFRTARAPAAFSTVWRRLRVRQM